MMWSAALLRFIRRRIVLGIILAFSFTYCIVSLIRERKDTTDNDVADVISKRTQPFIWRSLQEHNVSNDDIICRNSIQGKFLIVDDKGFTCQRQEILPNGCCYSDPSTSVQYSCKTCNENHCCEVYEYCVSCCLHPGKREMLEDVLGKAVEQNNVLFASVTDHFELCLAKCRTNSQSVQHENSYKDAQAKHCYGDSVPNSVIKE